MSRIYRDWLGIFEGRVYGLSERIFTRPGVQVEKDKGPVGITKNTSCLSVTPMKKISSFNGLEFEAEDFSINRNLRAAPQIPWLRCVNWGELGEPRQKTRLLF